MKWRKWVDEKPENDTRIIYYYDCEMMDSWQLGMGFYGINNDDNNVEIMCTMFMDETLINPSIKYWIPLEELESTLPKDGNKHPLEVIRDMNISLPRKYLTKQETLDLIPDKECSSRPQFCMECKWVHVPHKTICKG